MTHLSLNLEPLESRRLFSAGGEVVITPDPEIVTPTPQFSPSASAAFLKIGERSTLRAADFFSKSETAPGGASDGFLKVGEAALEQASRFFLKVDSPQVIG